jgi:UDP-N-acetylglucosamine/UDP-N-acetylgalactosamine diphosphorylase
MNIEEAREYLKTIDQEQLLRFYPELSEAEQASLLSQIEKTDFTYLTGWSDREKPLVRGEITPIRAMETETIRQSETAFRERGLSELKAGRTAAVLLAGGMGTRLGSRHPKGMYNIGLTKPVYIFQRLLEDLKKKAEMAGRWIHLFIMTSEKNDAPTREFLTSHSFFGYDAGYVHFFRQSAAPVAGEDGRILLEAKDTIATSPNGNGGWFVSLRDAGLLDLIRKEGISWLNVFSVDNVLQNICDPVFIGAVLASGSACGSKVVRKSSRDEKVGVMCLEDGKPSVVEYIEMTDAMLDQTDTDGQRAYNFGVILNYLFPVAELEKIMDLSMPVHYAHKKVSCLQENGDLVLPDEPNAWKFEYFILDMVHHLGSCLPFEVDRKKEFAPVKNLKGSDSVDSARLLLQENGISL